MLRPEYIENLPDRLIELYSQVEIDILMKMAERISKVDMFIPATEWQYHKLREMGLLYDEILEELSQITGKRKKELARIMKEAGIETVKADNEVYRMAGYTPMPLKSSPVLQAVLQAGLDNTNGLFDNLTKTTAHTATKQFEHALDRAYMKVSTGAFDYNSAIKSAIKELSQKGIGAIEYPSGHIDTIEVATRRAVVTGVNQTAAKMQLALAKEMNCSLVQVTAHAGARMGEGIANHAEWQGKVYRINE